MKIFNFSWRRLVEADRRCFLFKGSVSQDNPYSIFFIDHILLVLLEALYGDFKFRRIFAVFFNQKGNSSVYATPVSLDSSV